jgi:hypothetical protein
MPNLPLRLSIALTSWQKQNDQEIRGILTKVG